MAKKTEAYVDTAAFIAFLDRSDSYHGTFSRLFAEPPRLVTSPLVIAEGQGWFLRRFDQRRALEFLAFIEELSCLDILPAGEVDVRSATLLIRRYADQKLTLADALGLHLMQKRRISECWSTDRHLTLAGAKLVIY